MNRQAIEQLLRAHKSGDMEASEAARQIAELQYEDVGFARIDHARAERQGFPEVVFGEGKTRAQIAEIVERLVAKSPNVLVTRTDEKTYGDVRNVVTDAEWHASARLIRVVRDRTERGTGEIAVVTAGTSDIRWPKKRRSPPRRWATVCAACGTPACRHSPILAERSSLQSARVIVVAAGMEGALPSVVGGLVRVPVIAVPTSIGYGASFGGVAALLGMLNSCASNVTVVNIDNGFGAGFVASLINRRRNRPPPAESIKRSELTGAPLSFFICSFAFSF
ncbi:MAG: nickel pincer cofactor biosynthesis protein LarB [Pyrinomonadaceae bacterium]